MLSANQKYKEYKRAGGALPFNNWVEEQNKLHLNVTGQEIKEKAKDFFKPADQSKVKSGVTVMGIPASTFTVIVVGVIIIGVTYYYYTNKKAQTA